MCRRSIKDALIELVARARPRSRATRLIRPRPWAPSWTRRRPRHRPVIEGGKKRAAGHGGERVTHARGAFVQPTIFDDIRPDDPLARDEIFGPVLSVIPFDREAEAVRMANDSVYGLAASVWTAICRRHPRQRALHAGTVSVNTVDALSAYTLWRHEAIGLRARSFAAFLDKYTALKTTWIKYKTC